MILRHLPVAGLLAAALAVACVACGDSSPTSKSKTAASGAAAPAGAPAAAPAPPKDQGAEGDAAPTSRPTDGAGTAAAPAPERKEQEAPPPPKIELPPLAFASALPAEPVATVNDQVITQERLLRTVLEQNLSSAINAIVMSKVAEKEIAKEGLEVTDAEVAEELKATLEQVAPGKSVEEVAAQGTSLKHLRTQARMMRSWKEIFWKMQKVPEDQQHQQINQMLLQFIIQQKMQGYEQRLRGKEPAPPAGLVAMIIDNATKDEIHVTADEALDFLMGLVKLGALVQARTELIDDVVLEQELAKQGASVGEAEIASWVAQQIANHQPPFTWEAVCRMKGTTVDREIQRYRRLLAVRRLSGGQPPTPEELTAFRTENEDYFKQAQKKVSHILVRTVDDVTMMSLGEEAENAAKARIDTIHKKALEGVDFGYLAENYSDDTVTAKGSGRLAAAVRPWGGGLDPKFQTAAWNLQQVDQISEPVKSSYGWHVIKLDESNPGKAPPSWDNPRYQEWIQDEFETRKMERVLEELRGKAKITTAPIERLSELKDRRYFEPPKLPEPPKPPEPTDPRQD